MSDIRSHCSLSDDDFEVRRRAIRERLVPGIRRKEALPDGMALFFDPTPARRAELETFVDLERQCCPGLRFGVSESDTALRLEVRGIDPGSLVFDVAEAPPTREPARGGGWRALRHTGLGAATSFGLFCGVPVVLAALVGSAPLAMLDDPWVVGGGAVVLAVVFWRIDRSRAARRTDGAGGGCRPSGATASD